MRKTATHNECGSSSSVKKLDLSILRDKGFLVTDMDGKCQGDTGQFLFQPMKVEDIRISCFCTQY